MPRFVLPLPPLTHTQTIDAASPATHLLTHACMHAHHPLPHILTPLRSCLLPQSEAPSVVGYCIIIRLHRLLAHSIQPTHFTQRTQTRIGNGAHRRRRRDRDGGRDRPPPRPPASGPTPQRRARRAEARPRPLPLLPAALPAAALLLRPAVRSVHACMRARTRVMQSESSLFPHFDSLRHV